MTNEERSQAPSLIAYELETLYHQSTLLYHAKKQMSIGNEMDMWRTIHTAALESFLVHYRCLKDFLNNVKHKDDDVLGLHYAQTWNGNDNVPKAYDNEKARLDKLLAHISYKREELGRGAWERLREMEANITKVFERYLKEVNQTDVHSFTRIHALVNERNRIYEARTAVVQGRESVFANSTATIRTYEGWWLPYDCH